MIQAGPHHEVDVAIIGGGIAGLWLGAVLQKRRYRVALFEGDELGGGQTLSSQGMIHGGLKYALTGRLTRAAEAIAGMPQRWRSALTGEGELDLSNLEPLSDRYFLFADDSARGRISGFFASRALRGRIRQLAPADFPAIFRQDGFRGVVYEANDLVLDTRQLVAELARRLAGVTYHHRVTAASFTTQGGRVSIHVNGTSVQARQLVLAAGAGNQELLRGLGYETPRMQLRPLHQVVVRHRHPHPMYAHCLTGMRRPEPRLTITSHHVDGYWLWYLGGQLATDGVQMDAKKLADHARDELENCVPWLSWKDAQISTLRIDRAEPRQAGGLRPDEAFAQRRGPCIVCWPTKLSLVPDLADRTLSLLDPPAGFAHPAPALPLPAPAVGHPPWARPTLSTAPE